MRAVSVRHPWTMRLIIALICTLTLHLFSGKPAARASAGLLGQLVSLSRQHDFPVSGLEQIGAEPEVKLEGNLFAQIARLLDDYNHVVIRKPDGGVRRLIILSRKQATSDSQDRIVVPTQRRNEHHLVAAQLYGPNGEEVSFVLTIDTGASFVVLPLSASGSLGFDPEQLEDLELGTANGKVNALKGVLSRLQLGEETIDEVEVVFLEEGEQNAIPLLGMNVLGRYRMTLDDENDVLILQRN